MQPSDQAHIQEGTSGYNNNLKSNIYFHPVY